MQDDHKKAKLVVLLQDRMSPLKLSPGHMVLVPGLRVRGTAGPRTTSPGGQLVLGPSVRGDSWSGGDSWSSDNVYLKPSSHCSARCCVALRYVAVTFGCVAMRCGCSFTMLASRCAKCVGSYYNYSSLVMWCLRVENPFCQLPT